MADPNQPYHTFAVVLLHGLMGPENELRTIAASLCNTFKQSVLIIQPRSRARTRSILYSIEKQAQSVFQEIQSCLASYKQSTKSLPMVIIGYSQGGLIGCMLAQHYADQLDIQAIVAINAPLMGTPILERAPSDVKQFLSKGKKGLDVIYDTVRSIHQAQGICLGTTAQIKWKMLFYSGFCTGARFLMRQGWMGNRNLGVGGIKDMFSNSKAIERINNFLKKDNHSIPCLLIATYQDSFEQLFSLPTADNDEEAAQALQSLNSCFAIFTTGQEHSKHDTLIPLSSQLARTDPHAYFLLTTRKGAAMITPMLDHPLIQAYVYKDVTHAGNLVALDPNLFIMNDTIETVITSPIVQKDICTFIARCMPSLVG